MKKVKSAFVFLALIVISSSCNKQLICEKGNGEIASETRSISGFTKISSEISANVFMEESPNYQVIVESDENLLDNIRTEVINGELVIDTNNGGCIRSSSALNVYVKGPSFNGVSISGSGDVVGNDLNGNSLDLSISGSGKIELRGLNYSTVDASISGSGDIELSGSNVADLFEISVSGSGDIRGYDFPANHVDIQISGSGDAVVYPIERLDAHISGSGDILFRGTPSVLNTTITGSGSIKAY